MVQGRRVRRVIRKIDTWSVLKVSILFYLSLVLVLLLAGVFLWIGAEALGAVGSIEDFMEGIGFEDFQFVTGQLLRGFVAFGLVLVVLGTGFTVLLSVLYNLISDVVGGIQLSVLEEARPRSGARPGPLVAADPVLGEDDDRMEAEGPTDSHHDVDDEAAEEAATPAAPAAAVPLEEQPAPERDWAAAAARVHQVPDGSGVGHEPRWGAEPERISERHELTGREQPSGPDERAPYERAAPVREPSPSAEEAPDAATRVEHTVERPANGHAEASSHWSEAWSRREEGTGDSRNPSRSGSDAPLS